MEAFGCFCHTESVLWLFRHHSNVAYRGGRAIGLWYLFRLGLSWFLRLCLLLYRVRASQSVRRRRVGYVLPTIVGTLTYFSAGKAK